MKRRLPIAVVVTALVALPLSACTFVKVYDPNDGPDAQTGSVAPLSELLGKDADPITLVFVHGVSDHCRGYALGNDNAKASDGVWLNPAVMSAIGLTADGAQQDTQITAGELGVGDKTADSALNMVLLRERSYKWRIPGETAAASVRAVEVTWSPMTRWIKNTLLGYDAAKTAVFSSAAYKDVTSCSNDPEDQIGKQVPAYSGFLPPPRLAINSSLKWSILDRDLADAVIYAGVYGQAMQRGMAVALCRIAGGGYKDNSGGPCEWPTDVRPGHFIFVTHSLGSRLLYDTLLNLMDPQRAHTEYPEFIPSSYERAWTNAPDDAKAIVKETVGFYMMANQLTMLGMAHVPIDAPVNVPQQRLFGLPAGPQADPLMRLLAERAALRPQAELAVVSFNDSNDLLTWHIPPWYLNPMMGDGAYGVKIADVFVKNATHWAWLLEWPESAHGGYFSNSSVWQVMYCGADKGRVRKCRE